MRITVLDVMRRIYTQISGKWKIWLLPTEMMQTFGGKRQNGNLKFCGKRQILSIGSEKAKMV